MIFVKMLVEFCMMVIFTQILLLIYLIITPAGTASSLSCYECNDCVEHPAYLNEKVRECPDKSYVSCLKTESKFAHYTGESN